MGTPGKGAPTPLSLPLPGWGRGVACLPLPLCQLLAVFPKHLVGVHWVSGPGWTPVYSCGAPSFPQAAPAVSPRTRKGLSPGVHRHQNSAQAPAWFPGPALGEEASSRPGKEVERGREPDPTSSPPPLCLGSGFARGGGVKGKEGGPGQRRRGHALGGTGGGEGCSLPPPRERGPAGRAARARGQTGPPTQG